MPRNGAGVYSLVNNTWFPPVTGVLATSTDWSTFISDVASALTQSVSSDGQTPFTGNLPMGNNKITGLANGTAATDAAAFGQIVHAAGQGRLTKSGGNLLFSPFNGNQIAINGAYQTIPSAGVTLAPGAVVALTLYYIYAFMVGTTMTLEASTTGHSTDVTTGVEIKTGDATRSLVGMARPIAGPLWQDTINQRFVVSWFNQRSIACRGALAANQGSSSTSYLEINASMRCEFLLWGGSTGFFVFQGAATNNLLNTISTTQLSLDGVTSDSYTSSAQDTTGRIFTMSPALTLEGPPSEGYHFVTPLASQNAVSTTTYIGGVTAGARCVTSGTIQG